MGKQHESWPVQYNNRAVRRCFRWGGHTQKVGTKSLDKVALALPRGWVWDGNVSPFAPPEAKFLFFMFSDITVLTLNEHACWQ